MDRTKFHRTATRLRAALTGVRTEVAGFNKLAPAIRGAVRELRLLREELERIDQILVNLAPRAHGKRGRAPQGTTP
jgi:hypothetical protein